MTAQPLATARDAGTRTMRAGVLAAPGRIGLERVALPEPGAREVRIRLEGSGVCGSNLPVWEGRPWFQYPLDPGQPGHEGWGVVEAIGDGVTKVAVGDRVAALSFAAYGEYDVASEDAVAPLPLSLAGQPFPGEPLGCAVNVFRRAEVTPGQTVVVIGIGFLGAVVARLAARAGARVIAVSRRPFALEIARGLGAEITVPLGERDAVMRAVRSATGGAGADRVIEAIGLQEPLDLAGEITRERGRLVIAGYHQDGMRQVNMQLWNWRGLDVINAHERDPRIYMKGIHAAIAAAADGTLDPAALCTHKFPLDRLGEALETMRTRPDGFLKAVVIA